MKSIYFNNKNSFTDLNLVIEKEPPIPVTYENIELIEVEGRSGALTRRLGTFDDKKISVTFKLNPKRTDNFYRKIDAVVEWLSIIDSNELVFSFDMDRKYIVKKIECEDINKITKWSDSFQVTFTCEPFKYPITEELFSTTSTSFTVYNFGSIKSNPYIKIYGTGNITLSVNGNTTIINSVDGYVELDSEYFLCYKGTTNMLLNMNGSFPQLERGANNIVLTGTVTQTDIDIRTRYL